MSGKTHSDGWGIAAYQDGTPSVEKAGLAAHADLQFSETA